MPTPNSTETQQEFISRCIPVVINEGTARNTAQAYAICRSFWDREQKDLTHELEGKRNNPEETTNEQGK